MGGVETNCGGGSARPLSNPHLHGGPGWGDLVAFGRVEGNKFDCCYQKNKTKQQQSNNKRGLSSSNHLGVEVLQEREQRSRIGLELEG